MLVYFPHIPKAGGQTLLQGFYQAFTFKNCIKVWNPNFGANVSPDDFPKLGKDAFAGVAAVVGHLPVRKFLANTYTRKEFEEGRVLIFTSVRDPLKRIVSLYNYMLYNEQHPHHEKTKKIDPSDFVMNQPANVQYNFITLKEGGSLHDIQKAMTISPIENSIAEFSDFLHEKFSIKLKKLDVINKSIDLAGDRSLFSLDQLDKQVIEKLYQKHQVDLHLYKQSVKAFPLE